MTNGDLDMGRLCRLLDGREDGAAVASACLVLSVDDHLGGVDAVESELAAVFVLPLGPLMRGKRIAPAVLVPVVDVLAEHDDGGSGNGLFAVELGEQAVGGWATGAALGGEELDEDGWRRGLRRV